MSNNEIVAVALLKGHRMTHTVRTGRDQGSGTDSSVTMTRPRITQGMSMDSWKSFQVMWRLFKTDTDVSKAECGLLLIQCCGENLLGQLFRADFRIFTKPEIEQLSAIRKLAVVPAAMGTGHSETIKSPQKKLYNIQGKNAG